MANSLKFRRVRNYFQQKMKKDIAQIKSSNDVFMFANKTKNLYKSPPEEYKKNCYSIIEQNLAENPRNA